MIKKYSHLLITLSFVFILIPEQAFSAQLLFNVSPDPKVVEVRIDPQSKEMNVVEGTIKFSGAASDGLLVQIENGESILPIWPTQPQYDKKNKSITFVGGIPNGFMNEGLLLKLKLSLDIPGELIITYLDGNGYLNDGKGTKEFISSEPFKMYVEKEDFNKENKELPSINKFKYVIIILLLVTIIFIFFKYVFKKNFKQ
jgi:hypothetical protein